jgi:hypothetical protein
MIIYKTINTLNQRYYIGKDAANNLNYYGSGRAIKAAIKKYGKKNFTKQTIEVVGGTDLGKLLEREIYWIDKYDAINDKKSYNIQRDSGLRPKVTTKEETRKKISAAVRMAYETNEDKSNVRKNSVRISTKKSERRQHRKSLFRRNPQEDK